MISLLLDPDTSPPDSLFDMFGILSSSMPNHYEQSPPAGLFAVIRFSNPSALEILLRRQPFRLRNFLWLYGGVTASTDCESALNVRGALTLGGS
jgi:hypothetical protein